MAFVSYDTVHARPADARGEPGAAGDVSVVEGSAGIAALEPAWREIAAAARDEAVFLSFGYALAAARYHEARGERVAAALVEWAGRPACLLAVAVVRRTGARIAVALGDPVTQYSDVLIARTAPTRLADVALRAIATRGAIDLFEFRRTRGDSALTPALVRLSASSVETREAPFADLTAEDDAQSLLLRIAGAKHKRERARSRRRLGERGALAFEVFRGAAAVDPLAEAFRTKAARLARSGLFSPVIDDPNALALLQAAARDPEDGAAVVVARLTVGGAAAAYEVGLVRGGRFHAYLGAVDDAFAGASPGKVVMEETFCWAKARGLGVYDLLPPGDRYKREWSTGAVTTRDFLAPATLRGRLYAGPWLKRVRPALRDALRRMPPPLRRLATRAAVAAGIR
ncbi:MAG: hypothetical protein DI565_04350 [Ancylobacter novellus]|uniref:BioF2-like acetyltransferase domain-containing protein n=1 Tax=Ancylobacter novellus TaxID=921 RepID=A0A2W5KRC4_ANCNO|nr:MAG: hypothetical protein DI565_04350 [Ancylobacter novellus]